MPVTLSSCRAMCAALLAFVTALPGVARADSALRDPAVLSDATALRDFASRQAARPRAAPIARTEVLARPLLQQARLSPDGRTVAALVDDGRVRSLQLASRADPAGRVRLARTAARQLAFSHEGRWLFLVEPSRVLALSMQVPGGASAVATLGGVSHRDFAGVDPWHPAAVLLRETPPVTAAPPRVFRLWRAQPGAAPALLLATRREIVDFSIAADGSLGHLLLASGEAHVLLRRTPDGWRPLAVCQRMQRCAFAGPAAADGSLLLRSDLGGDRLALLRVAPDGAITRLHEDPFGVADLDDVVLDPRDNRPLLTSYRSTVARNYALDAAARGVEAATRKRFPDSNLALEAGAEAWLVRERRPELRTDRLFLVDATAPATPALELFAGLGAHYQSRVVAPLGQDAFSPQRAVRWLASDGLPLHGFVVLPAGVAAAKAPMVVVVHGGPFNHVQPLFNAQVQLLANRGYVVFLPNFRSSTGFGRRFVLAAHGDFTGDGAVQRDIVEGTRWLLAQGIGDPARVGIVGASFGGFSVLNALTFQPDLFRVGIASVPPSDFGFVIREYLGAGKPMQPGIPIAASMRHLGIDPADQALMARLAAGSPQAQAVRMVRPLLLLAGGEDDRVPIRGVTHYAATLQGLRKDVSLFVDADAGHGLADPRTREAYLYLQELLLHRRLGGPAAAPPAPALAAHIERNLRLAGASLADLRARSGARALR